MPKVSVIVPNYNHAPYLRQRLDSIFNQTFQDFEVIILDDCSTDNSKEIIEQYRSNLKVSHIVYNETNSGSPFKQWAKGFELAQGEYIWIAESDDWAETNFLEEQLSLTSRNKSIAIAFTNSYIINKKEKKKIHTGLNSFILDGKVFVEKYQAFSNMPRNASAVIFSRNSLLHIPIDYKNFKNAGDWFFWILISQTGMVAYNSKPLNYWREHDRNTTKKNRRNGILLSENYKIYQYLKANFQLNWLQKQLFILFQIRYYNKYVDDIYKNKELIAIKKLWTKELIPFSNFLSLSYLILIKLVFNKNKWQNFVKEKYCTVYEFRDSTLISLLWKALSLPQTNFRKKIPWLRYIK